MPSKKRYKRGKKSKVAVKNDRGQEKIKQRQSRVSDALKASFWTVRKVVVAISSILALIVVIYSLIPKVSIIPTSPLNPQSSFSFLFAVKNEGLLPIDNVWFYCRIREAKRADGWTVVSDTLTRRAKVPVPILAAGEATSTFCEFPMKTATRIVYADIEVVTSYKPKYWPWDKETSLRFVTVKKSDGSIFWIPKALSEN